MPFKIKIIVFDFGNDFMFYKDKIGILLMFP